MRLDKFLKVSRLIKRRTLAKEICDAGRVCIQDRVAKAGAEVRIGDVLSIRYGQKTTRVRISNILEHPKKEDAIHLYEILSEELHTVVDASYVDDES